MGRGCGSILVCLICLYGRASVSSVIQECDTNTDYAEQPHDLKQADKGREFRAVQV